MLKKMVRTTLMVIMFGLLCCVNVMAASKSEVQSELVKALYGGSGGRVSCDFDGYTTTAGRHEGIDCAKYKGATVYSLVAGTVVRANDPASGLSTLAIYDSARDKSVIYLHATSFKVKVGQTVSKGQAIAVEGTKGTGSAHTHVEVRNGKQGYASISQNDPVLNNENPYPYWESVLVKKVNSPFGAAQQMEGKTGSVYVRGWAIDEDALTKSLEIHVYVGEKCYARIANLKRTDVGALHKGAGDYHGFEYTIPVTETGRQRIRVFAINVGSTGSNTLIGETYVNIGKANSTSMPDLKCKAHVEEKGWLAPVSADQICGTTGEARKMEALIFCLKAADGKSGIKYRSHCQDKGWEDGWRSSGEISGTVGKNLRLEAVQIALCNGLEKQYDVLYRTHVRDLGWTAWVKNGATSGSTGKGLAVEAVQLKLVRK